MNLLEGLNRQVWLAIVVWGELASMIFYRSITQVEAGDGLAAGQVNSYPPRSGRTGGAATRNHGKRGSADAYG